MYNTNFIEIEEVFNINNVKFIDVRSPKEFEEYHIPNSINVPILSDEERHNIGIIHKEEGPIKARREGLSLVTPKLNEIVNRFIEISEEYNIVLYCARGGMRSQSISRILELVKVPHRILKGGYKSYRKFVLNYLTTKPEKEIVVLHGLTGVGKTLILKKLMPNAPVIDIEMLANHRGSAFGSVGLGSQPTQKMFESLLFNELIRLKDSSYIIVECESRRTGRINLPAKFFEQMKNGTHIHAYTTVEHRVERIMDEYGPSIIRIEELSDSIKKLRRNLGNEKVEELLTYLEKNEIEKIIKILLVDYYDPLYGYSNEEDNKYKFNICADNIITAANTIKDWCDSNFS